MNPNAALLADGDDGAEIAAFLCVDPAGLGGVALRAPAGDARDAWLRMLGALMPEGAPLRRVPLHIHDDRLLGGLDLTATLSAGRPVVQRGVLAESDQGIVLLCMAERVGAGTAARIAAAIDMQGVAMERDGLATWQPSRFGVVALDEGIDDDERIPAALRDRLAFQLSLDPSMRPRESTAVRWAREDVGAARKRLPAVEVGDAIREALCAAAMSLGVASIRGSLLALRAARASAALNGRAEVTEADAAVAARLVLAPRATMVPQDEADLPDEAAADESPQEAQEDEQQAAPPDAPEPPAETGPVDDVVLEAALAAIPKGLLDALKLAPIAQRRSQGAGRSGAPQRGALRGRPNGVRRGEPRANARLNVIETLRAAAPWQGVRRRESETTAQAASRIQVRREDFHVTRFKQRSETTTVFVVDASGSSALHRLAEAKGAVELLLADCYVRRDSVALIAFRGRAAELLLPPTRSLVRAKRSLAGLPGGGGTPLAAGIDAAAALADNVLRAGRTPVAVLLTDGRANIARDGSAGRPHASADAMASARQWRASGVTAVVLDTSPQAQETARELAFEMGATYVPLPHADAALLSRTVRAAGESAAPHR